MEEISTISYLPLYSFFASVIGVGKADMVGDEMKVIVSLIYNGREGI